VSIIVPQGSYIFHTDLGPVVVQSNVVINYGVEDIIHDRAMSQALSIRFLNLGNQASPNDPTAARTIATAYSQSQESLT